MKRDLRNKDFLPYRFLKKKEKQFNKGHKRWAVVLIITAIILLPISIDKKASKIDVSEKSNVVENSQITYSKMSIVEWLEICNGVEEGEFKNAEGSFVINGNKELEEITMKKSITIESLEYLGEEKFRIIVRRTNL